MGTFSGPQPEGAKRKNRETKRLEAEARNARYRAGLTGAQVAKSVAIDRAADEVAAA